MTDWNSYFKRLREDRKHPTVNKDETNAPINYAPPCIQKRYKKLLKEQAED